MLGFGRPAAEIEIVTDREVLRPGDTVRATVRLTPRKDLVVPTLTANPGYDESQDDQPVSDDPGEDTRLIDRSERWGAPTSRGSRVSSSWQVQVIRARS
jgi:hypothetical protein